MTFYEADLCNKQSLKDAMSKHQIDCVIHFAALKAVGESCALPLKYYGNNITGSSNLMEVRASIHHSGPCFGTIGLYDIFAILGHDGAWHQKDCFF